MIGVCIPAHNEEALIRRCLLSVLGAARHPSLRGEPVLILLVVDASSDRTASVGAIEGVAQISVSHRNVGLARGEGASALISAGARWLAFTDADSFVPSDWIARQISYPADAVCGTVRAIDWGVHGPRGSSLRRTFYARYRDAEGHRHVHGANLGVSAKSYAEVGGFDALPTGEDHALIKKLREAKARIIYTAKPHVWTSARRRARAPNGFAASLLRLEGACADEVSE